MVTYRLLSAQPKTLVKIIHAVTTAGSLILMIIALDAVFEFSVLTSAANMYTLHSWVGMIACVLLCIQVRVCIGNIHRALEPAWLLYLYNRSML